VTDVEALVERLARHGTEPHLRYGVRHIAAADGAVGTITDGGLRGDGAAGSAGNIRAAGGGLHGDRA
jgi:hypothetical protein